MLPDPRRRGSDHRIAVAPGWPEHQGDPAVFGSPGAAPATITVELAPWQRRPLVVTERWRPGPRGARRTARCRCELEPL